MTRHPSLFLGICRPATGPAASGSWPRLNRWGGLLTVLVGAVLLWASSTPAAFAQRTIRVATEGADPPFNYVDGNNEPQGFEVDLAKALCEAMKATCTFVIQDWDTMIDALIERKFDAIMSSMPITPERRRRIAFSKRYYIIPSAFIGQKDSDVRDVSPASLAGKTVGTTAHSEFASMIEDLYPGVTLRTYDKPDEANLDLLTNRIDLVLGDKLALSRFLESREGVACCKFIADVPLNPTYNGEGMAVGLRKGDKELKEMFNTAIDRVIADGTYDRIRAKYFNFDIK